MTCRAVNNCRVCEGSLEDVLDLDGQALAGRFPKVGEPDPPAFPLVLGRCKDIACGLVQLRHTVDPELMFRDYWYRSGVTQTMRDHLRQIAHQSVRLLGRVPERVLDIGCNTGELLRNFWGSIKRYGCDPSAVAKEVADFGILVPELYPTKALAGIKFDLIFTIACFYDTDQPLQFARAVYENLADDGLWCIEVASLVHMIDSLSYDAICHEHLLYFDESALVNLLREAGFELFQLDCNDCNGGSIRLYARKQRLSLDEIYTPKVPISHDWRRFHDRLGRHRDEFMRFLCHCYNDDKVVHLLGASTKANTMLQYCWIFPPLIRAAADKDERKWGRQTPKTHIPIVSEEESRAMKPDIYLVGPRHFRSELIEREKAFLQRGGKLLFPLPELEIVGHA